MYTIVNIYLIHICALHKLHFVLYIARLAISYATFCQS